MAGNPVTLLQELIRVASVTPVDGGCQQILMQRLEKLGFTVHPLRFGVVENFYARLGQQGPNLCLAGHTDVVPTGPEEAWSVSPFAGDIRQDRVYGRGACDMKGGLAAMVAAVERFLAEQPAWSGSLSFLVTGDEEAEAVDGTVRVLDWLDSRNETLDYCLLSEPTSLVWAGDCVKNGRRGSVNGTLRVQGRQGHVAHPHLADNPIHKAMPILDHLAHLVLDQGNQYFPPSCLQITSVQAGAGATNVIPGHLDAAFNIRFCTENTPESLEQRVRQALDQFGVDYHLTMQLSAQPFLASTGFLLATVNGVIQQETGQLPQLSTGGGTSDARFISQVCPQILELGLIGKTAHHTDEHVTIAELEQLTRLYQGIFQRLFCTAS